MSAANSPNYFYANSLLSDNASEEGLTNFLTVKDTDQVNLIDKFDISSVNFLEVYFQKCQNETSLSPCASFEQIDAYIGNHTIVMGTFTNFVEYDDVEPGVGPIKRIYSTFSTDFPGNGNLQSLIQLNRFSFIEHQVSLEDSHLQIMTEAVEFKMLNIDETSKITA